MEWFYQLAIRVGTDVAGGGAIPLSMQNVNNPYTYNVPADTFISTMVMPSNVDSFHYFACRWPLFDGTLVHSDLHSHQPFFKGCFLYKGLPALLGLGEGKCKHEEAFTAIPISSTGFGSSEALREHLLSDLTKLGHTTVCNVDGQLEKVDGEWYDRVSLVSCTPTRFRAGDAWTVVGFFGQRKPGERMFGLRAGQPAAMHTNPHLYYVADDGKSHYTSTVGTSFLADNGENTVITRDEFLRFFLYLGTPPGPPTTSDRLSGCLFLFGIWLWDILAEHDYSAPGLWWVVAVLVAATTLCCPDPACCRSQAGSSKPRGCPCDCLRVCCLCIGRGVLGTISTLALLVAIVNYSVPPTSYFLNDVDSRLLIYHDVELAKAAPLSLDVGFTATVLLSAALVAKAVWRIRAINKAFNKVRTDLV